MYVCIGEYRAWGHNIPGKIVMDQIIDKTNTHWSKITSRGHNDPDHTCYGTNSTAEVSSRLMFGFRDIMCKGGLCEVKVEYLHSWDTSYIAAATCDLYAKDTKELVHLIDSVSIVPNKCGHHNEETVTGTYLCPHYLKIRSDSEFLQKASKTSQSLLSVECRSKELGKLACIGAVELFLKIHDQ